MTERTTTARPIERYFARYSENHQNATNQQIHVLAVPAILWSVIALLWCIPISGTWCSSGVWAALSMFAAWSYYNRLSRPLGFGMLGVFFFFGCLCRLIEGRIGLAGLFATAVTVFVLAWVAQFAGHKIEGRQPSFANDPIYLLIGPIWVLAKAYRQLGWRY